MGNKMKTWPYKWEGGHVCLFGPPLTTWIFRSASVRGKRDRGRIAEEDGMKSAFEINLGGDAGHGTRDGGGAGDASMKVGR